MNTFTKEEFLSAMKKAMALYHLHKEFMQSIEDGFNKNDINGIKNISKWAKNGEPSDMESDVLLTSTIVVHTYDMLMDNWEYTNKMAVIDMLVKKRNREMN